MTKSHSAMDAGAIGNRVREKRVLMHITQERLAEYCELSTSLIGQIERGEKTPSLNTVIVMSRVLGISLDVLILGGPEMRCGARYCPLYEELAKVMGQYERKCQVTSEVP